MICYMCVSIHTRLCQKRVFSLWAACCVASIAADRSTSRASIGLHLVQAIKFQVDLQYLKAWRREENPSFLLAEALMWMQLHQWSANAPWGEDVAELEEFHLLAISCVLAAGLSWCGMLHRGSTAQLGCQCRSTLVKLPVMLAVLNNYSLYVNGLLKILPFNNYH